MSSEEHFAKAAFFLQDLLENKNGRHPDCVAAIKKYGTIKEGKWLYIDRDKIPEICGHFNPMRNKECVSCGGRKYDPDPIGTINVRSRSDGQLREDLEKEGIQWGSAIAWVTKKLGIQECGNCAVRKELLDTVKERGWLETIKLLKQTL